MQKVALCLQAHNLKNATVRILTKRFNNVLAKKKEIPSHRNFSLPS